jgi:hypothetical protein
MIRDPMEYYYRIINAPLRTRKLVALFSTITFGLVVFVIWASTFSLDATGAAKKQEVASSPLASIFESVQSLFRARK